MRRGEHRQDLIIGMTLAEVFLLALLVGWLGTRHEVRVNTISLAELRRENAELEANLQKAESDRDENKKLYEELLKSIGGIDPRTGEVIRFGEKPKCDVQDNVLIKATMRQGIGTVRLLRQFESLGARLTLSEAEMGAFLRRVRDVSDKTKIIPDRPGCRWQYLMDWETDADYRAGRQLFEDAFYVKQLNQVSEPPH